MKRPKPKPRMLLSEAILKGCKGTKKCRGSMFKRHHGQVVACCVLGAAAIGVGFKPNEEIIVEKDLLKTFPVLRRDSNWSTIVNLNDESNWSRERIAKWVRDNLEKRSSRAVVRD